MELESTVTGPINATAFMEVAQRLTSKGYTALPQEDHIKIMTPEKVRFTIVGMSSIEEYCRTDALETAPFDGRATMAKDSQSVTQSRRKNREHGEDAEDTGNQLPF